MARCQICNKTGQSGNNVSHSKRRTRTRWFANVQRTTMVRDGRPQKVYACTRCIRTETKSLMKG